MTRYVIPTTTGPIILDELEPHGPAVPPPIKKGTAADEPKPTGQDTGEFPADETPGGRKDRTPRA